ncbi:MAG: endonuclease/exonuclease/phosphatase family protein [Anaerolineae bacterium]|nr:endonuclease/exonuclease/phosphatase family protein [Anaerolineae bacterium]
MWRGRLRRLVRPAFIWSASIYATMMLTYFVVRLIVTEGYWRVAFINSFSHWFLLPVLLIFPAALLLRTWRTALGLLPVFAVAIAWFGPYFTPKFRPASSGETTIRVLTLNMWVDNWSPPAVEEWIRSADADLVLLQEVPLDYSSDGLPNLLDAYPHQFNQVDDERSGGDLILARVPIVETEFVELNIPNLPPPLRVVVETPGGRVAVYNVHLDWPGGYGRSAPAFMQPLFDRMGFLRNALGYNDFARNLQIARLLERIDRDAYPVILGGDFNLSSFSPSYGLLHPRLHDSFREAGFGLGTSWPVAAARGMPGFVPPLVRIDYIWHDARLRTLSAWQGPPVGSDHLPLLAELELLP